MFSISESLNAGVTVIIAALPVLATLFFSLSEVRKRKGHKLNKMETSAVYLVFWGFLLFAFWENFGITVSNTYSLASWLSGWTFPIVLGIVFTIYSYMYTRRQKTK